MLHRHAKIPVRTNHADGSAQAWVAPAPANCGRSAVCSALGAGWVSSVPDAAVLVVRTSGAYEAINNVVLDIDDHPVALTQAALPTRFSETAELQHRYVSPAEQAAGQTSTRGFRTTLAVLRQVMAAQRVSVHVHTATRTIDALLFDDDADSDAHRAIAALLDQVDELQKAKDD
jgi:hypothetical protein